MKCHATRSASFRELEPNTEAKKRAAELLAAAAERGTSALSYSADADRRSKLPTTFGVPWALEESHLLKALVKQVSKVRLLNPSTAPAID